MEQNKYFFASDSNIKQAHIILKKFLDLIIHFAKIATRH